MRERLGAKLSCCGMLMAVMLWGCVSADKKLHYVGDADLQYYKDRTSEIEYTNVCSNTPEEVINTDRPHSLKNREKDAIWDLSLQEAIQLALQNNRIIRTSANLNAPGAGNIYSSQPVSVYSPAIQESGVLFGGRGVEAALADFDAQFSTSMTWGKDENIINSPFALGSPGSTQTRDSGAFTSQLSKQFANGGSATLSHNWDYLGLNSASLLYPSSYTGVLQAQYRHPLLAGAGTEYTRIAGPRNANFGGITGVSQGVLIARINHDITLADFEATVRNMVKNVEDTYWELYLRYRQFDAAVAARNSSLRTWRDAETKKRLGGVEGFDLVDVPQSLEEYYRQNTIAQSALAGSESEGPVSSQRSIYSTELRLRRLLGLPVNDGRIIRPADEPTIAEFMPDWCESLAEALTNRLELRKKKWEIKSLELQLKAAKSLTRPQLDFVSGYRVNGFGDSLMGQNDNDPLTAQGTKSAYETLTQGNQTGWDLGVVFSMPVGFRSARAQVRNYELRLAQAREQLAQMELEISYEMASAVQAIEATFGRSQLNFHRGRAGLERVRILNERLKKGTLTADPVLRARSDLLAAQNDFYGSIVAYMQSITNFQYRKGTLLEYNNIYLSESEWTPVAYRDALRRARARSHGIDADCLLKSSSEEFVLPGGKAAAGVCGPHLPLCEPQACQDGTCPDAEYIEEGSESYEPSEEAEPVLPPAPLPKEPALNSQSTSDFSDSFQFEEEETQPIHTSMNWQSADEFQSSKRDRNSIQRVSFNTQSNLQNGSRSFEHRQRRRRSTVRDASYGAQSDNWDEFLDQ